MSDLSSIRERLAAATEGKICNHTHSYWAGIVRTCPICGSSYDKTPEENEKCATFSHYRRAATEKPDE